MVSIHRQYAELSGELVAGPAKSRAGTRTGRIRATIVAELREHITAYTGCDPAALVFTGPLAWTPDRSGRGGSARRGVLRRGNFRRDSEWTGTARKLACRTCSFMIFGKPATPCPRLAPALLISRPGWVTTVRAATIYQHATAAADRAIADALGRQIEASGLSY
jgi:hypothetical protein